MTDLIDRKVAEPSSRPDLSPAAAVAPTKISLIKVSDYIARFLVEKGVRHVFMLTGGGAMHLNDAFGNEPRLQCICQHHEQACSMAAEGYARVTSSIGVLNVTTGPGGINSLNGVFGAWTDSIPLLVVSGQVRRDTVLSLNPVPGLRQLGDQEADIISMARGITKYAVLIDDPAMIRYHLEKAYYLALSGRPGPVWIDVPIDVQGSRVDPSRLRGFNPSEMSTGSSPKNLAVICNDIVGRIQKAKRPVIMIGSGVRLAGALDEFDRVVRKLGIPVTTAWTTIDAMASDDPLYCGRPGVVGDRAGNFTVQNSDFLIIIGCRLTIRQISYNWQSFARAAYKVIVDIDQSELAKPMIKPDLAVCSDAKLFLAEVEQQLDKIKFDRERHADWLAWCKARLERYPVVLPQQRLSENGRLNPYHFLDMLFEQLSPDAVVVCGDATASVVAFQVAKIKAGQRVFTNAGCAAMGYDLPAAVGAAVARNGQPVICLAGDGSVQLNIQELQTIVHHNLPVKLFVLNNNGYLSMRLTQDNFFKRRIGEGPKSGVSFPDMVKVGQAYGIRSFRLEYADCETRLKEILAVEGPVVVEVMLDANQGFEPKLGSRQLADGKIVSSSLEDMSPLLSPEELAQNMLIPPIT